MKETREVYVGDGETKTVTLNDEVSFYLDLSKLEKIIIDNPDKEIVVGASGDWFFTAQSIDINKFKDIINFKSYILRNSSWSRFEVRIDDVAQDCTVEIPKYFAELSFKSGYDCAYNKMNIWTRNLIDRFYKLGYEKMKKLGEEFDVMLKKAEEPPSGEIGLG